MSSTLSEGVRVPDIGSTSWGADVNFNWGLLNTALANISGNVKTDVENTWTAPQTFSETISGSIDRAVGDEDGNNIKAALAGKQPSLSQSQLDACNSGVTAAAVQQIGTNTSNISSLQTAVSGKAADNAVVHKAGAETITGNKTFTGAVLNDGFYEKTQKTAIDVRTNPSTTQSSDAFKIWSGTLSNRGDYLGGMSFGQLPDGSLRFQWICFGYPVSGNPYQHRVNFRSYRDGNCAFYPEANNDINLGTSSAKWKTLNGINPGALSLPNQNGTARQALDTTGWVLDGSVANAFTPSFSGWLNIRIPDTAGNYVLMQSGGAGTIVVSNQGTGALPSSVSRPLGTLIPVTAGVSGSVRVKAESITGFFYPCLGNV